MSDKMIESIISKYNEIYKNIFMDETKSTHKRKWRDISLEKFKICMGVFTMTGIIRLLEFAIIEIQQNHGVVS